MSDIDLFFMKKQSAERRTRTIDFSDRVPSGVTISSATVACVKASTLELVNDMLASTTATVSGGNVSFTVLGGESGVDYRITVTATLSDSEVVTGDVMMRVQDY